jgi:hypothetical protein
MGFPGRKSCRRIANNGRKVDDGVDRVLQHVRIEHRIDSTRITDIALVEMELRMPPQVHQSFPSEHQPVQADNPIPAIQQPVYQH